MTNDRHVEINEGEMFMVSENLILAQSYESVFGMTGKIGLPTDQPAYLLTIEGRKNNSTEQATVTLGFSLVDAWNLCTTMLDQFEWLQKQNEQSVE